MGMIFLDDEEETEEETRAMCCLCSAYLEDGHWSTCPLAPKGMTADDDPDSDNPEQSVEFLY